MSAKTYEIRSTESCDDAPHTIIIDPTQFQELALKVSSTLKELDFNYATSWFAGADYTFQTENIYGEVSEVELPYGYHQHLKIYSDGSVQLVWEHKHDASCEFWADLGVVTA